MTRKKKKKTKKGAPWPSGHAPILIFYYFVSFFPMTLGSGELEKKCRREKDVGHEGEDGRDG